MPFKKKEPETPPEAPVKDPPIELERVISWRMERLLLAGATMRAAEILAERDDIDLHIACLVVSGVSQTGSDMDLALAVLL